MASLLDWLGGQVEGAFAQINPFDNSEDYGSVQRRRRREEQARPQPNSRPPVRPSAPRPTIQRNEPSNPIEHFGKFLGDTGNNLAMISRPVSEGGINPLADVGKGIGNFAYQTKKDPIGTGKQIVSGIQQAPAKVADFGLQGQAVVGSVVDTLNPNLTPQQRDINNMRRVNQTENIRNWLKNQQTVTGEAMVRKDDWRSTGNFLRDAADLTGRSLDVANSATMFINPARSVVSGAVRRPINPVIRNTARDAGFFGTLEGTRQGLETYSQTGDFNKAVAAGTQAAGTSALAQGVLGMGGYALGRGLNSAGRAVDDVASANRAALIRSVADKQTIVQVPTRRLISYEGAPDRARVEFYKSEIASGRPVEPLIIMKDKNNRFGVEDGKHRLRAYQELGISQVPSKVVTPAGIKKIAESGFVRVPGGRDGVPRAQPDGFRDNVDIRNTTQKSSSNDGNRPFRSSDGQNVSSGGSVPQTRQLSAKDRLLGTKPADYFFGDKKLVQEAIANRQASQSPVGQNGAQGRYTPSKDTKSQAMQQIQQPATQQQRQIASTQKMPVKDTGSHAQSPSPDNTARTGRTYPDDTSHIDTKQYVKELNKAQKNAQKGSSGIKEKASDFKEKFIDDLAPIEDRLNKAIKSGAQVDPKDHITYQLDRSRRSEGIMNAYVRDNGLDKIVQNVPDTKEFDQYLIARHAKELDPEVRTGRDPVKDAALVKQLDSKYSEAAKELYKYNQKLLDTSVEYGLISKATANKLKKQYPEYAPLNRIFNEDELASLYGGSGKGNASISKQNVVKRLKGSNRAIASPLNSIIDKTRVVVEQGERNRAAQMLASYKDLPGNPFNLKEIPSHETIGGRNTISYLDKGKKRVFEVDKEIADAAKNMTRQEIGLWGRIAAVPARVLRGGATTVNVGFAGANVVKDVVGAAINSRHPFRLADPQAFGKALAAALNHNGKYYQELMREGVAGTSFDMFRNPLKTNVGELRSHKNIGTRLAYNLTHPGQYYRTLENTIGRSEDFGRALQYYSNKAGFKAENMSDEAAKILAADQARHNSTNFFRHGSVGRGVNLAIPYWNAGVQGARIQGRRIKERPVQTLAKIGFAIAAPSAMIAVNNYANEKNRAVMEQIPDYEKEGNIIIVGPDAKLNEETGKWEGVFKIPVPPQHIGIHKTIQDAVASSYTGKSFDVLGNLGSITENYTTINPTDLQATANRYTPQGLKLIAEPMTNTNFFTGNKIVPDSQKNLPAPDQYSDYTSGTAKVAGKLTGLSPRQIDNAIRTSMGGAGQNLVNLLDNGLAAIGAIDKKEIKGQNVVESITRRFYGAASINPSDKAEETFGELKKKITETDAYKNASQYDKSRMLNRLENDINAVAWHVSGKSDSDKDLTKKQKSLLVDGLDVSTYTNLDESSGVSINKNLKQDYKATLSKYDSMDEDERKKWFSSENDAEYRYSLAKFENDKANGTLSAAQELTQRRSLRKEKIGSSFSKDVRDLYNVTESELAAWLSENDGKTDKAKIAEALLKYDRALYDAGVIKYLKYKGGFSSGGGKGGRKGNGVTAGKALVSLTRQLNNIDVPKTTGSQPPKMGGLPQMKRTPLKRYSVKKATVQKGKPTKIKTSKA